MEKVSRKLKIDQTKNGQSETCVQKTKGPIKLLGLRAIKKLHTWTRNTMSTNVGDQTQDPLHHEIVIAYLRVSKPKGSKELTAFEAIPVYQRFGKKQL